MKKNTLTSLLTILMVAIFASNLQGQQTTAADKVRWELHAKQVNIIRDEWDIPHIYGKTDADAIFGLMYAQCEENFAQIELNYLEMLGRTAEVAGANAIYEDLMMRLIQDSVEAIKDFNKSPVWFKNLLQAHADGLNYYLYKHPEIHPKVITYFKPWYHLMWTDGSVSPTRTGGIKTEDVANFYGDKNKLAIHTVPNFEEKISTGSNGFAIAPMHSKNGNALLYINPHVPFYFRSEMHMNSEEGLNVYGAVTWGQMFIYQGFNEHCGWMHTSSYADVADVYEEKMKKNTTGWVSIYENEEKKVAQRNIRLQYTEGGVIKSKSFITYKTIHGPVMGSKNGKWLSLQENNRSLNALLECWTRTKATHLQSYQKALSLLANNSNNTVYADGDGNIAYWHGNFMPKRNPTYNYSLPVDGSIKRTNWNGVHPLNEIVQSINPSNGWLQNCNATPFTVAGIQSPKAENYPSYMAPDGENGRGITAVTLLEKIDKISLDDLIRLGYNRHMSAFDVLLPSFLAYAKTVSLNEKEKKAIQYLSNWNHDGDTASIATAIAIEWATEWSKELPPAPTEETSTHVWKKYKRMVTAVSNEKKLELLNKALTQIEKLYGSWEITWGSINRYQRVNPGEKFNDQMPSIAVGQASSKWGTLPAFESKRQENTNKRYGYSGSSFIAAVSFGKKLEAKTIITGGQSRFANSTHFTDQAQKYIAGDFKTIHFYKDDVLAHEVISYKPGFTR
ncbi:MAG: penicillin acylase family protein [Chitinophagia bacterium]